MHIKHDFTNIIILLGLCLSLAFSNVAWASPFGRSAYKHSFMKKDDDYKRLMGLTAGIGKLKTENNEEDGALLYANAFMFWFNLSFEYQDFGTRSSANTYTGVGLGRYIQLQYGYGDEGYVVRLRSEFEVVNRFTVFIGRERYRDKPEFDNYSAGIGYNF